MDENSLVIWAESNKEHTNIEKADNLFLAYMFF